MRVPYIARIWDTTLTVVHLTDGLSEDGVPNEIATYTGKCNFSEKSKTIRQSNGTLIRLSATLTIGADIAPTLPILTGSVDIGARTWQIVGADRPRNPDGTVHHTVLRLS
ncbi:MAG: hypothetical protein ABF449_05735 [Ethanoligenens sp.]